MAAVVALLWVCAARLAPNFYGTFIPELTSAVGQPVMLLAFAALEVAAAAALLRRRRWAAYALLAVGVAQLAIFPIGSALALYTFYALWPMVSGDEPYEQAGSRGPGAV